MRIFRSVFFHYSVDPQNYRMLPEHVNICDLQCMYVTGPFARTEKVQWKNAMTLIHFSFFPEHCYFLTEFTGYVCLLFFLCLPILECKLYQVGKDLLFIHQCVHIPETHNRYSMNICWMNKWIKMLRVVLASDLISLSLSHLICKMGIVIYNW